MDDSNPPSLLGQSTSRDDQSMSEPPLTPPSQQLQTTQTQPQTQAQPSSFDIYRDKRNLPPTKRFKNFTFVDSSSSSRSTDETTQTQRSNSSTTTTGPSTSSLPDEDRLVIDVDKDASNPSGVDNKLLDLAKIALERETN